MRILIVNTVYKRGGGSGIAQTLHRELNRLDGWESLFAYGRGAKAREPGTIRFALQPEVYLHVALTRLTGLQGYGTWLSTKRLIRLIREWKPDVIHFHNIHDYYLNLGIAKAVDRIGIPVVWTLHDAWSLSGRCGYFLDCGRWKTGCGRCPYPSEYPKTYFDSSAWMWPRKRKLLGEVWKPVIVTPSKWLAALVTEACNGRCDVKVILPGKALLAQKPTTFVFIMYSGILFAILLTPFRLDSFLEKVSRGGVMNSKHLLDPRCDVRDVQP